VFEVKHRWCGKIYVKSLLPIVRVSCCHCGSNMQVYFGCIRLLYCSSYHNTAANRECIQQVRSIQITASSMDHVALPLIRHSGFSSRTAAVRRCLCRSRRRLVCWLPIQTVLDCSMHYIWAQKPKQPCTGPTFNTTAGHPRGPHTPGRRTYYCADDSIV
jgi:hypothetical protein